MNPPISHSGSAPTSRVSEAANPQPQPQPQPHSQLQPHPQPHPKPQQAPKQHPQPFTIQPLTAAAIPAATACIQRAFSTDPYFTWVFPSRTSFSPARNTASLTARLHWGLTHGLFYTAHSTVPPHPLLGISCWLPPALAVLPEHRSSWTQYFWQLLSAYHLLLLQSVTNTRFWGRGGLSVERYQAWKRGQEDAQSQIWRTDAEGVYFLNIVTVDEEARGLGVGRALVEVVTRRADEEGLRCYLESSLRVPNVEVYARLGFELVREMRCRDGGDAGDEGVTLFCMVREPVGVDGVGEGEGV